MVGSWLRSTVCRAEEFCACSICCSCRRERTARSSAQSSAMTTLAHCCRGSCLWAALVWWNGRRPQAHVRQQHMRRATSTITTTTATRPQPPHPSARPDLTQPRAAPATQHPHPTARAQQPAEREISLDHSTIVCDDQHDDLQTASGGPPRFTASRFRRGGLKQAGSPRSCRPRRPAVASVTNQRDAEPPQRHHPACRSIAQQY